MIQLPLHNYTDSPRCGHSKLTHETIFCRDKMGMLRTINGHGNIAHVSLGPKMTVPGARGVTGWVLPVPLAWDGFYSPFGHAPISQLLAVGFGRSSGPRRSTLDADHNAARRFVLILLLWLSVTRWRSDQIALYMYGRISLVGIKPRPGKMTTSDSSPLQDPDRSPNFADPPSRGKVMDARQNLVKCPKRPKS